MQTLVGSLLWLLGGTQPGLATITSILIQHTKHATISHICAAKYVIQYLNGTKTRGIKFSSKEDIPLLAYLKFPTDLQKLLPLCDTNWGGQDQSLPDPQNPVELPLFTTRSISGFIIV